MLKSYNGSCHCGAVRFQVVTDTDYSVLCDCSMCRRRNSIMVRCDEKDLRIISGHDELTMYQFNTMVAEHYFCQICGVYTFHKMRKMPDKYAVNAGCLEGVDPYKLQPVTICGSAK